MTEKQSVIICTKNRIDDLIPCLRSLAEQTVAPDELIIVDSSDVPIKTNKIFVELFTEKHFPQVHLSYHHTKPGLTFQRNRGIEKATGDLIYFFDDDVVLEKRYLEEMQSCFAINSDCIGGMGTITNIKPISFKYRWYRRLFGLQRTFSSGNFTYSGMPMHPYGTTQFKKVSVVGGCCMAFRKQALSEEKFDESFSGYCFMEDADIASRLANRHALFFNPKARLVHNESPVARDKIFDAARMIIKNYSYLFFRNFYPKNRLRIFAYWWTLTGLFLEAILMRNWKQFAGYWAGYREYKKDAH